MLMSNELFTPSVLGRKIAQIRNLRGISQETLAKDLGLTRQAISKIEHSATIEDEKLEQIAKSLGVSVEGIKNFNEEATFYYIQNNYEGSSSNYNGLYECTFNPLEKYMELIQENRKLYQQLIQTEREKSEMLQKLLDQRVR